MSVPKVRRKYERRRAIEDLVGDGSRHASDYLFVDLERKDVRYGSISGTDTSDVHINFPRRYFRALMSSKIIATSRTTMKADKEAAIATFVFDPFLELATGGKGVAKSVLELDEDGDDERTDVVLI